MRMLACTTVYMYVMHGVMYACHAMLRYAEYVYAMLIMLHCMLCYVLHVSCCVHGVWVCMLYVCMLYVCMLYVHAVLYAMVYVMRAYPPCHAMLCIACSFMNAALFMLCTCRYNMCMCTCACKFPSQIPPLHAYLYPPPRDRTKRSSRSSTC